MPASHGVLQQRLIQLLPTQLSERCRVVVDGTPGHSGGVLYWMCTAVRTEENPALDAAILLAHDLQRPLLVYHALSEQYPFASDRHHTFILEGALDVQQQLRRRQIPYVFHLERPGHREDWLKQLADAAAIVITEDMPTDPAAAFLRGLSSRTQTPIVAVDTACICPMQLAGRAWDRAFQFRDAVSKHHRERLQADWPEVQERPVAWEPGFNGFASLELQPAALPDLVGACHIDHSVGPVVDTPGGTAAGMERWHAFRGQGLRQYAAKRNSPLIPGVSRMSAYLHYGMVSPFRIARECAGLRHDGAQKFLDELLIWRELAWCFCRFRREHETWDALPAWARQTLTAHAADKRPEIYSWERLAAGETDDPLWNAAQKSLRIHGELHNNVRMTWGKALLQWTADPRGALQLIIDLNNRYALDGRDPSSFGGILWCLGQFDRPFSPEQPILGTVRPRPLDEHSRRLDVVAWSRRTSVSRAHPVPRIAVIGAGISGAAAARTLADHALPVTVFEKSRGVGGRMAGRRLDDQRFDHGAVCFETRHPDFRRAVRSWLDEGIAAVWRGQWMHVTAGGEWSERPGRRRFTGLPGMPAIARHLLRNLELQTQQQIIRLERRSTGWMLHSDSGTAFGPFDSVILALPSVQAAALLADRQPALAQRLQQIPWAVIRTVMAGFRSPLTEINWAAAEVDGPILGRIIRNQTKPQTSPVAGANAIAAVGHSAPLQECLVLHSTPAWGAVHAEDDPEVIGAAMLGEFGRLTGLELPRPDVLSVHRWKYAEPLDVMTATEGAVSTPARSVARLVADLQAESLGICGDWLAPEQGIGTGLGRGAGRGGCCGVETAWLSGINAAGRVLRGLRREVRAGQRHLFGDADGAE
ncbi:MAG: FAD-dependent oxidoreductase [Planctomycetota bacterium]